MFEQSLSTFLGTLSTSKFAGMFAAIALSLGSCASEPPQPTPPPTGGSDVNAVVASEEGGEVATGNGDRRQLEPHLHGAATLNVAVEENSLYLEMTSPAIDIVGFEHQPKTDAQKSAVTQAIAVLEAGTDLFALPDAASCRLLEATVATELLDDHDEHGEHDHGEHEEEEAHVGEEEGEVHSEFMATYRFECAQPQQLRQIGIELFSTFPSLEEIEARVLTDSGQTAVELTPTQPSLTL
ncbi:MAG: DUF2796 domain-containing protein [Cyanobacteria bacterium J06641_5]